ncbi:MAG TPA: ATP-binding protein [Actinospica sp.]|nr:ATP-binding protein [Actinospica sp.]
MLLRFRAANVYSFRDEFELDLRGGRRGSGRSRDEAARVAAVYGANASGKSNVLKAMVWMAEAVEESAAKWSPVDGVVRPLFKLDSAAHEEASLFEAEFILDGIRYVYGFEVSDERIESEWLFEYATGRRRTLFVRDADAEDEFDFKGRQLKGEVDQIRKLTRPNALFVSMGAQLNNPQLTKIFEWFRLGQLHLVYTDFERLFAAMSKAPGTWFASVEPFLHAADLGVVGGTFVESKSQLPQPGEKAVERELRLEHRGVQGSVVLAPHEESDGTRAWISTVRFILGALKAGALVVHDELDSSLHPALVAEVLRVFRDPKANPHGAQLICTLHDVSLLGSAHADAPLDRREVWITEKDEFGRSELYPLTDARPATQENLERGYLRGRYGGVPRIGAGWLAMDIAKILQPAESEPDA